MSQLGTNTHFSYTPTAYVQNPQGVLDGIKAMNMTVVRENSARGVAIAKAAGLTVIGMAGSGPIAADMILQGADYIEGPNEFNGGQPPGWMEKLKVAWDGVVKARNAATRQVPLIAPSLSVGRQAQAIADAQTLGAFRDADYGNLHVYMANQDPATFAKRLKTCMAIPGAMTPGRPVILTETGTWWCDDPAIRTKSTHTPTNPTDAAQWWPGWADVIFNQLGIVIACTYEAVDEVDKQTPAKLQEGWFGLLDKDLKDKIQTPVLRQLALAMNAGVATRVRWSQSSALLSQAKSLAGQIASLG